MQIHNLTQGSPEWVAFRFEHFGASEAAAMLGLSTKMTRTELLHMKHVGSQKEFSDYVQKRVLDHGHAVEALARPIIEKLIGEDLYPVTCSNGKQSASCDGLTMAEEIAMEHKQWAQALAASVAAGELPEEYQPQCQQIMKITKAKKVIFVVSDGTRENMVHMEVLPDPEWFYRIDKGWAQFDRDLAAYIPAAVEVKPIGMTPETLPALRVEVTGMVTASNLAEYKSHALTVIGAINRDIQTDQDFANAAKAVKWCSDVESRLEAVKQHALSQTESIDLLFKTIDDIKAKARETRLDLDKLVTRRNTERKDEIILGGKTAYQTHLSSLKAETEGLWVELPTLDFAGAVKGMRLLTNMQDAVNTLLANSKIAADDSAKKIRANLALLAESKEHAFLFNDRANLIAKASDDLKLLIKSRIDAHKAAEEKKEAEQRERIRAEEVTRLAREQAERDTSELKATEAAKLVTHETVVEIMMPSAVAEAMKPPTEMVRFGSIVIPRAQIEQTWPTKAKTVTPPDLKLGQIAERLGFTLTADFLKTLGFEPAATDRASKLYHEADFPRICAALVKHISAVCELQAA